MRFEIDKMSLLSALNEWVSSGTASRLQQTLGDIVTVDFVAGQPIRLTYQGGAIVVPFNDPEYDGYFNGLTLLSQRVTPAGSSSSSSFPWWLGLTLLGAAAGLLIFYEVRRNWKRSSYRRRLGPGSASMVRY